MKYCTKCGKELPDNAAFCIACGEKQVIIEDTAKESFAEADDMIIEIKNDEEIIAKPAEPEENDPVTNEVTETVEAPSYIGKTCPFCKTEITADDEAVICPACEIAHHKGCWEENGGCTTFGCSGKASGTIVCYNCGADIAENQSFCTKCGAPRPVQERNESINPVLPQPEQTPVYCSICGSPMASGQEFCSKCGHKLTQQPTISTEAQYAYNAYNTAVTTKKAPNKGAIIGIAVAFIAVIAIVFGISSANSKAKKIEDYKAQAKEFSSLCWTCGKNIEDVGNDIQTYWSKYINTYGTKVYYSGHYMYSIDDAVSYALSDNSTTVATIKVEWSGIQKKYDQLKDVPDSEVNEIWSDVKDAYEAMEEMYDCVINVSGNFTSYKSNFSKCDTNLANALKALDNDLD